MSIGIELPGILSVSVCDNCVFLKKTQPLTFLLAVALSYSLLDEKGGDFIKEKEILKRLRKLGVVIENGKNHYHLTCNGKATIMKRHPS